MKIPTLDGSITLMQAKFFNPHHYDLTKAGHMIPQEIKSEWIVYYGMTLAHDIVDVNGNVSWKKVLWFIVMKEMHCAKNWLKVLIVSLIHSAQNSMKKIWFQIPTS